MAGYVEMTQHEQLSAFQLRVLQQLAGGPAAATIFTKTKEKDGSDVFDELYGLVGLKLIDFIDLGKPNIRAVILTEAGVSFCQAAATI